MTTHDNSAWRSDREDLSSKTREREPADPILRLARQAMAKVLSDTRAAVAFQQANGEVPSSHITEMANALTALDHSLAETMVANLLGSGVGVRDLCLEHLAPAARELGACWERDAIQFADVTMAAARIQSILRTIPTAHRRTHGARGRAALFASVPGETHTLGVIMAADHFRRLGWDVGLMIGMDHAELCQRLKEDDRKVIGLSCAGRHSAPGLQLLVDDIRRHRPDMAIIVSGNVQHDAEVMAALPYVDGIVDGLDGAEEVLERALDTALAGHGQMSGASRG